MNLIPYLRYSPRPAHAADKCDSPEVQLSSCKRYAAMVGGTLQEAVTDPLVSARKDRLADRPGGRKLLERLSGDCGVVAQRLDRLFRNTRDGLDMLEEWADKGIAMHLADEGGCTLNSQTGMGEFILTILLGHAALEPRLTAERTKAGMLHKQGNGIRMSARPQYGWEIDPDSPPHPRSGLPTGVRQNAAEQKIIGQILLLAEVGLSAREIARQLKKASIPSRGNSWHHSTVAAILNRSG